MHTYVSPCGVMHPYDLLKQARSLGLDLLCLTDHFTTAVGIELSKIGPIKDMKVFVGLEYTAPEGDFILLAPNLSDLPRGLSAHEVLTEVHRLGGIGIWAHPFRWGRQPDERLLTAGLVDAIEVFNGRTSPAENAAALELARKFGLPGVGGSDAHMPDEIGTVVNEISRELSTLDELIEAIRAGELKPKRGPRS